jgi:hypothetical protein
MSVGHVILDISAKPLVINKKSKVGSLKGSSNKMNAIEIGNTYTTAVSGVTGVVQEIVKNSTGSARVRLELSNGDSRWTTVKK